MKRKISLTILFLLPLVILSGCFPPSPAAEPVSPVPTVVGQPAATAVSPTATLAPEATSAPPLPTATATAVANDDTDNNAPAPDPPVTDNTGQAADDGLHPIIDGGTQFLLGASRDGEWLTAAETIPQLGARTYTLYNIAGAAGSVSGAPPAAPGGVCAVPTVTLQPAADYTSSIALDAPWDAAPRSPQRLSTDISEYQEIVAKILRQNGLADPEVQLSHVLRVDLEGDGVDEVLLGASRLVANTSLPPVAAGDYSLIILRQIVGDAVVNLPLRLDVYPEAQDLAYPYRYEVTAVLDLNGDGVLEIVVHGLRYEGEWVGVFQVAGDQAEPVLIASCGL